jgi:methylaspartate ammonia-lyase
MRPSVIIESEYGCTIASKPIPLLAVVPNEQKLNIDKMILKSPLPVNGTDQAARVSAHVALTTQADFLMAKPGQGVEEGLMILKDEM